MSPMRRLVLAGLVSLAALPALAQGFGTIAGAYRVDGMNPDGSRYAGTAQVTETGTTVTVNWQIGGSSFMGAGVREGRVVTINWGQAEPVVYVVMPSGALYGTWAGGTALDRLTPLR